jgi:glutathione S-transferase
MSDLVLVGRSSSHFTRLARIFAGELGVKYTFRPVLDMTVTDPVIYGDNPALKMPVLVDAEGSLFGCENICRELVRRSGANRQRIVMRGEMSDRIVANFEELTLDVMSGEVSLIFAKINKTEPSPRSLLSVGNSLRWLDDHVDDAIAKLPVERSFSFVEAALFCLMTHLPFREVMSVEAYARLLDHTRRFGLRESARTTEYRFDAA